jgi:hypothetical protein
MVSHVMALKNPEMVKAVRALWKEPFNEAGSSRWGRLQLGSGAVFTILTTRIIQRYTTQPRIFFLRGAPALQSCRFFVLVDKRTSC